METTPPRNTRPETHRNDERPGRPLRRSGSTPSSGPTPNSGPAPSSGPTPSSAPAHRIDRSPYALENSYCGFLAAAGAGLSSASNFTPTLLQTRVGESLLSGNYRASSLQAGGQVLADVPRGRHPAFPVFRIAYMIFSEVRLSTRCF